MPSDASESDLSVSVVIPTIGRPELAHAVESALQQSVEVAEVLVCLDSDVDVTELLPRDSRVRVLSTGPGRGGNHARQTGIESARGELVALLDDDDTWVPDKLAVQLEDVRRAAPVDDRWIATSRLTAIIGDEREVWPADLIATSEGLRDYIFRKHRPQGGQGFVQASTLVFPRTLAVRHPFDPERRFHQDVDWLNTLERSEPSLTVIQSARALTNYKVGAASVSKAIDPRLSLAWALENIDDPRSRGDFILTTVVIYASRRGRPLEVLRMAVTGFRRGRPGVPAAVFAAYRFVVAIQTKLARRLPVKAPAT